MPDFVYLFRSTMDQQQAAMGSPERAQQSMQAWLRWVETLQTNGHLKDRGQPLAQTGKVVRGEKPMVTDGPFVETKDLVLGFMIVEARDMDQAVELSKGCPMLGGGSVEVRPVLAMSF
jgi:hypothetical protein